MSLFWNMVSLCSEDDQGHVAFNIIAWLGEINRRQLCAKKSIVSVCSVCSVLLCSVVCVCDSLSVSHTHIHTTEHNRTEHTEHTLPMIQGQGQGQGQGERRALGIRGRLFASVLVLGKRTTFRREIAARTQTVAETLAALFVLAGRVQLLFFAHRLV